MANLTFTRTGDLTVPAVLNGTIQGNLSANDYVATGFTSLAPGNPGTFSVTIPSGSGSVTVSINPVSDSAIESAEGLLFTVTGTSAGYVRNPSALVTFRDDDVKTILRVAAGGKKLVSNPPPSSTVDGHIQGKSIAYTAPNQRAIAINSVSRLWLTGVRALLEFDVKIINTTTPGYFIQQYYNTTSYFKMQWLGNKFQTKFIGSQFFWDSTLDPLRADEFQVWQFLLEAGSFSAYLNGDFAFSDVYQIQGESSTIFLMDSASGAFATHGAKIRVGNFDWVPGVFNA